MVGKPTFLRYRILALRNKQIKQAQQYETEQNKKQDNERKEGFL